MASNYKLLTDTPAGTTSHVVLTATASSTVVASVVATDSSPGTTLEVLVKKAAGVAVILASRALTAANVPEEMLTAPVALEVNDILYVRTSRTGAEFVTSYVEDVAAVAGQSIDVLSDVDTTGVVDTNVLTYNATSGNWEAAAAGGGTTINALDDINDVQVPAPTGGDTITWNSGASKWINDGFLQDLKERIGKTVAQTGVYNTLNDTTKGFAQYNADGFDAGKNNTRLALSENSPGIIDFSVQDDDAVTPTETQAMRITNSTGGTTDPQIIMGTSTVAQAGNVLTVNGDTNVQGDITVTGSINGSISTQNISDIIVTAGANNDILRFDGTNWLNEAEASAFSRINGDSGSAIAEVVSDALAVNGANGITTVAENTTDSLTITFDGGMDNLSDATITTPSLNQVLTYNGSAWVNATTPAAADYSYLHDQAVTATTWTVTHNLNNERPIVQCYDALGEMIIPQTITITSADVLSIVFGATQTGKAVVGGGSYVTAPKKHRTAATGSTSLTGSHNLVGVTLSAAATITLPNPNTLEAGHEYIIKDEGGNFTTYNLTIDTVAGNIDGSATKIAAINYASITIYTDGANYFII